MAAGVVSSRRRIGRVLTPALVVVGFTLLARGDVLQSEDTAFVPVLSPVYEIEARSGDHVATLAGLPLPLLGAPQVTVPVDVDGDLIPDVDVSVNVVDADGLLTLPPTPSSVVAPNIEITRNPIGARETPGDIPLRIGVKLTVLDATGQNEPVVMTTGYDTGAGGTIPPAYKALVSGVEDAFNPAHAVIDTTGGAAYAVEPGLDQVSLTPGANAYDGPLTPFVSVDADDAFGVVADAEFGFRPMPNRIEVFYETVGSKHGVRHNLDLLHSGEDVDVDIDFDGTIDGAHAEATGRIDRLPQRIWFGVRGDLARGGTKLRTFNTEVDGRLPDLNLRASGSIGAIEFEGRVDAESVPNIIMADWKLPNGDTPTIIFDTVDEPIGAVEVDVAIGRDLDVLPAPPVPDERQFASVHLAPGGFKEGGVRFAVRIEQIRSGSISTTDDGTIEVSTSVGDGVSPLQVFADVDLTGWDVVKPQVTASASPDCAGEPGDPSEEISLDGLRLDAEVVVDPLPDDITVGVTAPDPSDTLCGPTAVEYVGSSSVDLTGSVVVALPGAAPVACGNADVICGDVALTDVPPRLRAEVGLRGSEVDVLIEATEADGSVPVAAMDGSVHAALLPPDGLDLPVGLTGLVVADVDLAGLPSGFRMTGRFGEDGQFLDAFACIPTPALGCDPVGAPGVADARLSLRSFEDDDRDEADFPLLSEPAETFLAATIRPGDEADGPLRYEVATHLTDLRRAAFVFDPAAFGAVLDVASGSDFRLLADIEGLDVDLLLPPGDDPLNVDPIDVDADIVLPSMPTPFAFCAAMPGQPLEAGPVDAELTTACQPEVPFGESEATVSPLALHYAATSPFDVAADIALDGDVLLGQQPDLPVGFEPFDHIDARVQLTDVPQEITALIGIPDEPVAGDDGLERSATRVEVVAPGAEATEVGIVAALEGPGASCEDPTAAGSAVCADIRIDGLPGHVEVVNEIVSDPDTGEVVDVATRAGTCDVDLSDPELACPPTAGGTDLAAHLRTRAGPSAGVPTHVPADALHGFVQADILSLDDFELEAGVSLQAVDAVTMVLDGASLDVSSRVGDGGEPFAVHGFVDLTEAGDDIPEDLPRLVATADLLLDPLPAELELDAAWASTGSEALTVTVNEGATSPTPTIDLAAGFDVRLPDEDGVVGECGAPGTLCGDVALRGIPRQATVSVERASVGDDTVRQVAHEVHVDFLAPPDDPAAGGPNVEADLVLGVPTDVPVLGAPPLHLQASASDVPASMTIGLDTTEHLRSEGGELVVRSMAVDRLRAFACDRDLALDTCEGGVAGRIGRIDVALATFLDRPAGFPVLGTDADQGLLVAGRGLDLEAQARVSGLAEVDVVPNAKRAGARVVLDTPPGDADRLDIEIDIADLPLTDPGGEITLPDGNVVVDPLFDMRASAVLTPFPDEVDVCFTEPLSHAPGSGPAPDFVTPCLDDPFGDPQGDALGAAVVIGGAGAPDATSLAVDADVRLTGADKATGDPIPPHRIRGSVDVAHIPDDIRFHLLAPETEYDLVDAPAPGGGTEPRLVPRATGDLKVSLVAAEATTAPTVRVEGALLIGDDASCEDPRTTVVAICAAGGISSGLPTELRVDYDFDAPPGDDNLVVRLDGPATTVTFDAVELTAVIPDVLPAVGVVDADVFAVRAAVGPIGLPLQIDGRLVLPRASDELPTIDLEVSEGSVPEITVNVQNYLAPDPLAGLPTALTLPERPVERATGEPEPDEHALVLVQRGGHFRFEGTLAELRSVSFVPVTDDEGPTGTTRLGIGFAEGQNIRAYVDLQPALPEGTAPGIPLPAEVLVDALIENVSPTMDLCFRAPGARPVPGGGFCEGEGIGSGEAAVEFDQNRDPGKGARDLDVDAFVRLRFEDQLIAARVDVDGIPELIRARIPVSSSGVVDVAMLSRGTFAPVPEPDGIDEIDVEVATFDLDPAATGYADPTDIPYAPIAGPVRAAEAGADEEHVHLAADLLQGEAHLSAQIGSANPFGAAARFQHLRIGLGEPCPDPPDPVPDFPRASERVDDSYTCILTEFDDDQSVPNALSLDARALLPSGETIRLEDGALSDIPPWFQLQIALADQFKQDEFGEPTVEWRDPCRPVADPDCIPPIVRFDQPLDELTISGVVTLGDHVGLAGLASSTPRGPAPDFTSTPTPGGWNWGLGSDPATDDDRNGLLLHVVDLAEEIGIDDRSFALRAPFRLAVPRSITVDAVQLFEEKRDLDGEADRGDAEATAGDFRFHAAARDAAGEPAGGGTLGQAAVFFHHLGSDAQVLLTGTCSVDQILPRYAELVGGGVSPPDAIAFNTDYAASGETFGTDGDSRVTTAALNLAPLLACHDPAVDAPSPYRDGFTVPSEVGFTGYLRSLTYDDEWLDDDTLRPDPGLIPIGDPKPRERTSTFFQLDGKLSESVSVGARLLGNGAKIDLVDAGTFDADLRLGDADLSLEDLPGAAAGDGPDDPSFRLRVEYVSDATPPLEGEGDALGDILGFLSSKDFASAFTAQLGHVSAGLDFKPPGDAQARAVDLVVHHDLLRFGVDFKAYDRVGGRDADLTPISLEVRGSADELDAHIFSKFDFTGIADGLADIVGTWTKPVKDFVLDACARFSTPDIDLVPACEAGIGLIDDFAAEANREIFKALEAFMRTFPLGARLDSKVQLAVGADKLSRLDFRYNFLHGSVHDLEGSPDGGVQLGPIDLYLQDLSAGWYFDPPSIPINKTIRDIAGFFGLDFPRSVDFEPVLLAGLNVEQPFELVRDDPVGIQVTECGVGAAFWPFGDGNLAGQGVRIPVDEPRFRDFYVWPLSDARIRIDGLLFSDPFDVGNFFTDVAVEALPWITDPATALFHTLLGRSLVGGAICGGLPTDTAPVPATYEVIAPDESDPDLYNPGNSAANGAFDGLRIVPGQGSDPTEAPSSPAGPDSATVRQATRSPIFDVPVLRNLFGGVAEIDSAVALCGLHRFEGSLTISADVAVATSADASEFASSGEPVCAPEDVGTLRIEADTIEVADGVTIDGSAVADRLRGPGIGPVLAADAQATSGAGGTNAGIGHLGSASVPDDPGAPGDPDDDVRGNTGHQVDAGDADLRANTGMPGSEVTGSETVPGLAVSPSGIGPGGRGGAAIVLSARTDLVMAGDLIAPGGAGAGSDEGACDADIDDNGEPGAQTHDHDGDPDTAEVPLPEADPPFEHSGVHGAGGGAGGTIVLSAGGTLTVDATSSFDISGGAGGDGRHGAGGGGAGGYVKLLGAELVGAALDPGQVALAGGDDGTALCDGIPQASAAGDAFDGTVIAVETPTATVDGIVPLWHPTPPTADVSTFGDFTADPDAFVQVCAVRRDTGLGGGLFSFLFPQRLNAQVVADSLSTAIDPATVTADDPCGDPFAPDELLGPGLLRLSGIAIREVARIVEPADLVDLSLDALLPAFQPPGVDFDGPYGLYATTVFDGRAEPFTAVEQVIAIDRAAPVISDLTARPPAARRDAAEPDEPDEPVIFIERKAVVDFAVSEPANRSGLLRTECRVPELHDDFLPCDPGDVLDLPVVEGPATIEVRGVDVVGNATSPPATVDILVESPIPPVDITIEPDLGPDGFHDAPPSITFALPDGVNRILHPQTPFVFAIDAGPEVPCQVTGFTVSNPPTACNVDQADVASAMTTGPHQVLVTPVLASGERLLVHQRASYSSARFTVDVDPPVAELSTVPGRPEVVDGDEWFSTPPRLFVSALDQPGGSGVAEREIAIDPTIPFFPTPSEWVQFDESAPPVLPDGVHQVCVRATDGVGHTSTVQCRSLNVDAAGPALTLDLTGGTPGAGGWFSSGPAIDVGGYDDGDGVGAPASGAVTVAVDGRVLGCDGALACGLPDALAADGEHLVQAVAVDRLGNERLLSEPVLVDATDPDLRVRLRPVLPTGVNGWHTEQVFVEVDASDATSGVAAVVYSTDGTVPPTTPYTRPFALPEGESPLCVQAIDTAGNVASHGCDGLTVLVDLTDPVSALGGPADPASGWFGAPVAVTVSAIEEGSGLGPVAGADDAALCGSAPLPGADPVGAGACVSVDFGPFETGISSVPVGPGAHVVRAFAVDAAGRRGPLVQRIVQVDVEAPTVTVRTRPPAPNGAGWFDQIPLVVLRGDDGPDGSGATELAYRIDGGPWIDYAGPFAVPAVAPTGTHTVEWRVRDAVRELIGAVVLPVDVTPPFVTATTADHDPWRRGTDPDVRLRYELGDDLSGPIRVTVVVYDALGTPVRTIDGGTVSVAPGTTIAGSVTWDGTDDTLLDPVPVGTYYYRVVAVDEADNPAQSGESASFEVLSGPIAPLVGGGTGGGGLL